jgi:hypothetical protein
MFRSWFVILVGCVLLAACAPTQEELNARARQDIGSKPDNVELIIREHYRRAGRAEPRTIQIVGGSHADSAA